MNGSPTKFLQYRQYLHIENIEQVYQCRSVLLFYILRLDIKKKYATTRRNSFPMYCEN